MSEQRSYPYQLPSPPSTVTGDLGRWLSLVWQKINTLPVLSLSSYSGGPNSFQTGAPGDLAVNWASSAQTARLYVKELGSGMTGWVSFVTQGGPTGLTAIVAQGQGTLSSGAAKVSTAAVTSNKSVFLTDAGGGVLANIGSLAVNGVTSGVSFAVVSSNALDSSNFNWLITGAV